jgi:hypothetical protein
MTEIEETLKKKEKEIAASKNLNLLTKLNLLLME